MNSIKDIENLLDKWQHSIFDYLPKMLLALLVLVAFYVFAKLFRNLSLKFYSRVFRKQTGLTILDWTQSCEILLLYNLTLNYVKTQKELHYRI